ncbi:MAG: sulfatase-like hydrolase/transferase [Gemmatimonadetes bacterium]|nr:sulfatase-like hydrolase/transferase [Gemmatimonadota bacterium]MYB70854.1 sulfatase-like hydrolase/transferase [Gemmatimonadota bacterium]
MPKRPNVILIVADDMGYGDFGVFNDGPARTPHLDALVGEGVEAERRRIQPDGSILEIVDG